MGRDFCLFCLLRYPQTREQSLTYSRHSVNIHWINKVVASVLERVLCSRCSFSLLHHIYIHQNWLLGHSCVCEVYKGINEYLIYLLCYSIISLLWKEGLVFSEISLMILLDFSRADWLLLIVANLPPTSPHSSFDPHHAALIDLNAPVFLPLSIWMLSVRTVNILHMDFLS